MQQWILVAVAGGLGSCARYAVTLACARWSSFPWGTLVVNVVGSLALGFVLQALLMAELRPEWKLAVGTGFLGAFTTYSTFSVETLRLVEAGRMGAALANVGGNLGLGLVGAGLGIALARAVVHSG